MEGSYDEGEVTAPKSLRCIGLRLRRGRGSGVGRIWYERGRGGEGSK